MKHSISGKRANPHSSTSNPLSSEAVRESLSNRKVTQHPPGRYFLSYTILDALTMYSIFLHGVYHSLNL